MKKASGGWVQSMSWSQAYTFCDPGWAVSNHNHLKINTKYRFFIWHCYMINCRVMSKPFTEWNCIPHDLAHTLSTWPRLRRQAVSFAEIPWGSMPNSFSMRSGSLVLMFPYLPLKFMSKASMITATSLLEDSWLKLISPVFLVGVSGWGYAVWFM